LKWTPESKELLAKLWAEERDMSVIRRAFPDRTRISLGLMASELKVRRMSSPVALPDFGVLQLDPSDAAWLAGFVDGEGCIAVYPTSGRNYLHPRISVANTFRGVLEEIQELLGFGGIRTKHQVGNDKESYAWQANAHADVYRCLKALIPYLRLKREQAELVCKFVEVHAMAGSGEQEIYWRLKALNRKGAPPLAEDGPDED